MTRRNARLPAASLVLAAVIAAGSAGAMVIITPRDLIFDEIIADDHADTLPGRCKLLEPYAARLDTFYRGQNTTLTRYLGSRYPGLLQHQAEFLAHDGENLDDPVTMLTFMIEGRLAEYNDWQANDAALRNAALTLDVFVRSTCLGIYSLVRDEVQGSAFTDVRDYDGDWRADLAVFRRPTGTWMIAPSNGGATIARSHGTASDQPVPGDYDGDRKLDTAVWNPANGTWTIVQSSNRATMIRTWGLASAGDVPVPNDYDGDGKTDVAVWRSGTGQWFHIRSSDGVSPGPALGASGDRPVGGDFDGDGKADLAVWRPSTGEWLIRSSLTGGLFTRAMGTAADRHRPVAADYDGDKKTDMATFQEGTGVWTVFRSSTGTTVTQQWGTTNDVPITADYDGDGKADYAVWRPSTGQWFHIRSYDGKRIGPPFGSQANGDVPLPSVYFR